MFRKCPACGSHIVRPSHFRGHGERAIHPFRSPYLCVKCGNRFFVISHKARQAAIGLLGGACVVFAIFSWLFAPQGVSTRPKAGLTTAPWSLSSSPAGSETATLAEIANQSRCTDQPTNVIGDTYKCTTRSGLTLYFVVPAPKP